MNMSENNRFSFLREMVIQLLMGMIGAAIVIGIALLFSHQPRAAIGTVNITGLIDQFIQSQAKLPLSAGAMKERVHQFGKKLEDVTKEIADERRITLLPSEAVIEGGIDYTAEAGQRIGLPLP